jgi:hypothetical protein
VPQGDSYHASQIRAHRYVSDTRCLGKHALPATVKQQVRNNLDKAANSTIKKLGPQYYHRVGACRVFGQAAISQAFLSDIKSVEKSLTQLAQGHTWSTSLLPGKYGLSTGEHAVLVAVTGAGTKRTAVSSAFPSGAPTQCHMVQVTTESWRKYTDGCRWLQMADAERTCAVFEKRLVHWLQDRLDGQRSSKQRKGLVARLKETWKMNSAPVFFVGQRVYARWTNDTGKLVPAVNRTADDDRGFEGTIAAEGQATNFWRVGFEGEPDHPGIPAKYIITREDRGERTDESL